MFFSNESLMNEDCLQQKWFVLNDNYETLQFSHLAMLYDNCDCQQFQSEVVRRVKQHWLASQSSEAADSELDHAQSRDGMKNESF